MSIDIAKEGFQIVDRAHDRPVVLAMIPGEWEIGLIVDRGSMNLDLYLTLEEWEAVYRCLTAMRQHLPEDERKRLTGERTA